MTIKQYLGLLGFLFVAAWIAFNLGDAVLCLVGAAVFAIIGALAQGEIDLATLQARLGNTSQRRS